jgi:1,5-anhydro-D-fructose reductase (1,5-anhydro-D-mannitol-forming)
MSIGWALLGPGRHAGRNVVPQMKNAAGTRLAAVVSRDRARGEAFAKEHGFARACAFEEALKDPQVQAIYDATPDGLHAGHAHAAVAAGKHLLIEKPLAMSVREGREVLQSWRHYTVKLGVVFNQRHEAAHLEARRMVLAGEIGDVVFARVQVPLRPVGATPPPAGGNWRVDPKMRPGGILWSIGDHAFDTLAWITGQDIDEVSAMTDAASGERTAGMMMKLSRGAVGYASTSSRAPFARRPFEIQGTKGSLVISNTYAYLSGADEDPRPSLQVATESGTTLRHFEPTECFRLEIEQFNRAVEGKEEPMTGAVEGLRALAVSEALYHSVRGGRVAKVADFL